jgi:hypothetical protein
MSAKLKHSKPQSRQVATAVPGASPSIYLPTLTFQLANFITDFSLATKGPVRFQTDNQHVAPTLTQVRKKNMVNIGWHEHVRNSTRRDRESNEWAVAGGH